MGVVRRMARLLAGVSLVVGCSSGARPALDDASTRDQVGRITAPGQVGILRLRTGDCFIAGEAQVVEFVSGVPCSMDHDGEVFAVFDMQDSTWPGATTVESVATRECQARFSSATGLALDAAVARLSAFAPTMDSWNEDRSIICIATSPDGSMMRGTLTGAGT